ncbi:MAG: twin-arginine translocase subunit TatC [Planctomycetota bacterium]|nr:twin-arginine translocase subunit TatC [Planctomycetota bacterium]
MAKHPQEDLFASSTMSFGDHLEELRRCLFRAMFGLLIGVGFGVFIAKDIVKEIQMPLKAALSEYYQQRSFDLIKDDSLARAEKSGLIGDENFIAEEIEIEIGELFKSLRSAFPNQISDEVYQPYSFVAEDFIQEVGGPSQHTEFYRYISEQGKNDVDWAVFLLGQLSDEQKKTVSKLAGPEVYDQQIADALAIINIWANTEGLYSNEALREFVKEKVESATSSWMNFGLDNSAEHTIDVDEVFKILEAKIDEPSDGISREDYVRRVNRFILSNAFSSYLRSARPATIKLPVWEKVDIRVQTLNAHEGFMIWLKAAMIGGIVIASPWIFYQIWQFIAAGLYPHERKYVYIYLPFSLTLFFGGGAMAFFVVMEPVLDFLFSYNRMMEIDPDPRISEWLGFVMFLPLGFGIAFQLPLVMLMLQRIGLFTISSYLAKWRVAVLVIFIVAMFLTPADPLSMLLLGGPLTVLYFLGILLCKFMPRNRNPYADSYDPA